MPLESDEMTMVRPERMSPPPLAAEPPPLAPVPLPPPVPSASFEPPPIPAPSHRHQATSANSGLAFPPVAPPVTAPPPENNAGATAKLVIERGRSAGKQFALHNEEALIGRWDADGGIFPDVDLDVDDPEAKVSRRHARVVRQKGQYYIEDLGSTNGTFVNRGRRLLPGDRHPLNDGDELIIGKMFLRFYLTRN